MAKKLMSWQTKGMNRDYSVSVFDAKAAFENINLRLATNEGNTMMSWVNERGTKELRLSVDVGTWASVPKDSLSGEPVGMAVLNHRLVLFMADSSYSYIYALEKSSKEDCDLEGRLLYMGNLGFSAGHPIETLVSYESENIQKVYWTDGINQPRMINIAPYMDSRRASYKDTSFDFVQELQLKETITVKKLFGSGEFPAGVIQYAFTYYNKYGQESSIFYTTPLYCIAHSDRGGEPGEKIANAFRIKVTNVDTSFDYIRIYSILRTSKDAVPLVKRVQDIETTSTITFTDSGYSGETVDPTELLYKGGEDVAVQTLEQKDGTLFLGNIRTMTTNIDQTIKNLVKSSVGTGITVGTYQDNTGIAYSNDTFYDINSMDVSGFKYGEYYRIGMQFQYKTGKWAAPIWLKDIQIDSKPAFSTRNNALCIPVIKVHMVAGNLWTTIRNAGYRKVRLVMAQPSQADRTIVCQGIANPTLYTYHDRYTIDSSGNPNTSSLGILYAQSSWFFRPKAKNIAFGGQDSTASDGGGYIPSSSSLVDTTTLENPTYSGQSSLEIGTRLDTNHKFYVDQNFITIHSPEIAFDESLYSMDFSNVTLHKVGKVAFKRTYGDIDIQTSSPTIGSATGFLHKSVTTNGNAALVSGLFYEDYIVDDNGDDGKTPEKYNRMHVPVKWPVALWQRNGSLNNDVNRDARSSKLLKKKVSNYHVGYPTSLSSSSQVTMADLQLFSSDEPTIVKVDGKTYMGNIDSMVAPYEPEYKYFAGDPRRQKSDPSPNFLTKCWYRLGLRTAGDTSSDHGIWQFNGSNDWKEYSTDADDIGDKLTDLCETSEPVRIKYKSTPHLVAKISSGTSLFGLDEAELPLVEVRKDYDADTLYGGQSEEALQANTWIPISNPETFDSSGRILYSNRGDTYYQRYECLKTYAYTFEDINQVVDIASFVCETHVNIDGRYDRNRGQVSNLNMSPVNFNLINPVYSQLDNFFNYRILDDSYYENNTFSNQVTWTKVKQNGADVDLWTNITLASTLEMDGDKGNISKLTRLNNQLLCFQDRGIAQILYNESAQVATTEGVPIEIANSEKVQGKRYYSDTVGCSNKWSITQTPSGIYFMDSHEKSIYLFNGKLGNLSTSGGLNTWAKQSIPAPSTEWTPKDFGNFITYYDKLNQEVLFISKDTALAYSEKFGAFTSFYDYGGTPYFANIDDESIWARSDGKLWRHQAGEYCSFFGENKPYSMTLVCNAEPMADKIFTNLEFRACVDGDGTYDTEKDRFSPLLPFDIVEVWDEYQHGILALSDKNGHDRFTHGLADGTASLNRKFRIWRCDLPRDNAPVDTATEGAMGIKRFKARPLDRIRNPWAYIKIGKNVPGSGYLPKVEVHDIMGTYYS